MPAEYRCFLAVPTEQVVHSLRRFAYVKSDNHPDGAPPCTVIEAQAPGSFLTRSRGYHNIETQLSRGDGVPASMDRRLSDPTADGDATLNDVARDDPRWPRSCGCGYVFREQDSAQEWLTRLYKRTDTGELFTVSELPIGALRFDDGRLICRTPGGDWNVDARVNKGPGWTWNGEPPEVVATPSIAIPGMHGWLGGSSGNRRGYLVLDQP